MGLFSGSFGTGLITGLASSVDRSMRDAITRRNSEMSEARKYLATRRATKLDAAEAKKLKQDEETQLAFDALARELGGDTDLTYAAFKRLGTAEDVQSYIADVKTTRKALQPGQIYDPKADFTGYQKGETAVTREAALSDLAVPMPSISKISGSDLGVDDPIGRMFGKEGQAAEKAAARLNERFASDAPAARTPLTGTGRVTGIDLSRQTTAQEAGFAATIREREKKEFTMKETAFGTNQARVKALTQQIADQEERAKRNELNAKEQKTYDRNRDALADAQRKTELEQQAEMFILEKRAKKLGITAQQLANQKAQQPPEFTDFEDMAVYATQKLAAGGLTPQQTNDFEEMKQQAIKGAKAWNAQTEADGNKKSNYSPQSVNAILDAQIKRTMGKAGLYDGIEDKVKKITEGNAESYFDNFNQAISAVEGTYGTDDEVMKNAIAQQENILAQDVRSFIEKQLAIPAQKSKRLKVFDGSSDELIDNAYTANAYSKGDIVQYKEDGVTKFAIWTGRDLYDGDY